MYRQHPSLKPVEQYPKIIRIEEFEPAENQMVIEVASPKALKTFSELYMTPQHYYAVVGNKVFKAKREDWQPKIVRAEKLSLDPTDKTVWVDQAGLAYLADVFNCVVYDTDDSFCIIGPGINWFCKKEEE